MATFFLFLLLTSSPLFSVRNPSFSQPCCSRLLLLSPLFSNAIINIVIDVHGNKKKWSLLSSGRQMPVNWTVCALRTLRGLSVPNGISKSASYPKTTREKS